MKVYVIILLYCLSFTGIFAQNRSGVNLDWRELGVPSNRKVDSIQPAFYEKSDSLKNLYKSKFNKLDSSRSRLKIKLDSLTTVQSSTDTRFFGNKIDSRQSRFTGRIDSLKLQLQTLKITNSLDSINNLRDSTLTNLNQKLQTVKDKTIGKLKELNVPPQLDTKVSKIKGDITGFKIPASDLNISLPFNDISNSSLESLNNLDLQTFEDLGGLHHVKENLNVSGISEIASKTGDYTNDIQELTKGNIRMVKELPNAAEAKVKKLSGLNEVNDQAQALDEYKDVAAKIQNPDSLKELAAEKMKQVAVNHFAGKEQVLIEAIKTISKYKSKYSSIASLNDIGKMSANEISGRPFIERLIPGVGIQVQRRADVVLVDFNPYMGYKFTGRITTGVGWNQRVAYNIDKTKFDPNVRIFGLRIYGEFKLWKGFSPRAELEVMNTSIPPLARATSLDPGKREWVWGAFVGIKKEYRFIKNVRGTALVMMRLFDPDHKSPYGDVINVRFGFEFLMKKKAE